MFCFLPHAVWNKSSRQKGALRVHVVPLWRGWGGRRRMHVGMLTLPTPALPARRQGPHCGSAWGLLDKVSSVTLYCGQGLGLSGPTTRELPVSKIGHWNIAWDLIAQYLYQKQPGALPCSRLWFPVCAFCRNTCRKTYVTYFEQIFTCKGVFFYLKRKKRRMNWVWGAFSCFPRWEDLVSFMMIFLSRIPAVFYKKTDYFWNATPAQRKWITMCQNRSVNAVLCG